MNRAGKIALGCLLAPIGFFVILIVFWTSLRMAGVPDARVTSRTFEQPLPVAEASHVLESVPADDDPGREVTIGDWGGEEPVRVILDLDEGMFTIEPGPAQEGIRVDADYDEATYELQQEYSVDDDGRPTYLLRFKSKISFLRRLAQDGSWEDNEMENSVTVQLPVDTPMDLVLALAKTEAEVDLTGLALTNLAAKFRMGEVMLAVDETNPLEMDLVVIDCSMGEFNIQGLSRLRAATIDAKGSMGEFTIDLDGPLERDTRLMAHMKMGEMSLRLPDNAIWQGDESFKATWGEVTGRRDHSRDLDPETAPVLDVTGAVFMGELVVDSYSTGSRGRLRRSSSNRD